MKYIFLFLTLLLSFSFAENVPDFAILLNEKAPRELSRITADQEKDLKQIISKHDVLTEGTTTDNFCWGGVLVRFFIIQKGQHYILSMMNSQPPECPFTFTLSSLDGISVNDKNEVVYDFHKMKRFIRIFEDEHLYKELFRFLQKISPQEFSFYDSYWEKKETEWKKMDEENKEANKKAASSCAKKATGTEGIKAGESPIPNSH